MLAEVSTKVGGSFWLYLLIINGLNFSPSYNKKGAYRIELSTPDREPVDARAGVGNSLPRIGYAVIACG
jgi:hypothetical protein